MLGKPLLLDTDVAKLTGASVSSVRKWRSQNRGPCFLRLGASVRYKEEDVLYYMMSGTLYEETGIKIKRNKRSERQ